MPSQHLRTDERHFMTQIRIATFVTSRKIGMGHTLEFPAISGRNGIPSFRLTEMKKIYRIQIHVFGVPGECGFPHAEIQIGGVYAIDLNAIVVVYIVENGAQMIDVPFL